MTFKEIKELIEIFDESNLTKLNLKEEEFELKLDKNVSGTNVAPVVQQISTPQISTPVAQNTTDIQTPTANPTSNDDLETINSPMVGTFYQAPAPNAPAFVKVGDKVKAGQVVCIVEAMKIMNDIQAEFDCEIVEILVQDGQAVEFDTPLFKVKRV